MSSLLTQAKNFEQKSKAQQKHIGEILQIAFSEHEQSVKAALNSSEKRISDAILAHEKGMSEAMQSNRRNVLKMVGRTWLTISLVSVLLVGTSGSILWWQGQQITTNYTTLSAQKITLAKLNEKTWGVSYQESPDGRRFLVIPEGTKPAIVPYNGTNWIQLKQE